MKKKTALQLLIDQWNKELQEPLGVLEDHRAYHVNDVKRAIREVRELNKRIDQATELLETEREQIEESFKQSRKRISILGESEIGMNDYLIEAKFKDAEQYYRDTYQ